MCVCAPRTLVHMWHVVECVWNMCECAVRVSALANRMYGVSVARARVRTGAHYRRSLQIEINGNCLARTFNRHPVGVCDVCFVPRVMQLVCEVLHFVRQRIRLSVVSNVQPEDLPAKH